MKRYIIKATYLMAAGCLLASMASCSTVSDYTGSSKTTKSKGGRKSHRDVLPEDRQQFIIDKAAKTYTPEELEKGIVKGDWAIELVGQHSTEGMDETPYIKFDITGHKIYAFNGCNHLNGEYSYSPGDKSIRFSNTLSTMRECDVNPIIEEGITRAINETRYYSWELRDSQYYLFLQDAAHKTLLTLMHQSFDFLNGTWTVKAIDDAAVNIPDLRLVIDVNENKIHGNTGCNTLNGTLLTEMDAPNSISFRSLKLTQRLCPDIEYENDLIVALEDAATAKPISQNKVLLINNHGVVVLELERAAEK